MNRVSGGMVRRGKGRRRRFEKQIDGGRTQPRQQRERQEHLQGMQGQELLKVISLTTVV